MQSLSPRIVVAVLASLLSAGALAQRGEMTAGGGSRMRRGPRSAPPRLVPFPFLAKSVPFTVIVADRKEFTEMAAFVTDLKPGAFVGLKRGSPVVQLIYGSKKGGVGSVYEMPKQAGLDPARFYQDVIRSGALKDRQYFPEWSIKGVPDSKLLIAVSGTTPKVRDALIRAIGR